MQDVMPDKRIDDLRQRALTTIAEINAGAGTIAESLRPYRIRHIENMIEALQGYSLAPETHDDDRTAAQYAVAEIMKQLKRGETR